MAESCPTPTKTGLFQRLISPLYQESTKRAQLIWVTWTLIIAVLGIGGCIAYRIVIAGDVGSGAVAAFIAVTGPMGAVCISAYRKPEVGGNTSSTTTTTTETSAGVAK